MLNNKPTGWIFGTENADYFKTEEDAKRYKDKIDGEMVYVKAEVIGIFGKGDIIYAGVRPKSFNEF